MAGFFSTNNTTENHHHQQQPKQHNNNNNNNWYLYRNHEPSSSYYNNMDNKDGTSNTYESWPQPQPQPQSHPIYHSETVGSDGSEEYNRIMMMRRISETSGSGGGTISCQDCGNQAKKDCEHMRCRTCCKSRGFDCATHVKSTWIPASVRRHRHHSNPNDGQEQQLGGSTSNVKRRRDNNLPNIITSSSSSLIQSQLPIITTTTTTTSAMESFGMELGNFPAEVSSPALFRCVRVSSMNDSDDEVAYQTAVRIGGHVFKGILYDQGPADNQHGIGSTSGGYGSGPMLTARPGTSTAAIAGASSSALGYIDPSLYPAPLSPYMPPGTQFFPNPRP